VVAGRSASNGCLLVLLEAKIRTPYSFNQLKLL